MNRLVGLVILLGLIIVGCNSNPESNPETGDLESLYNELDTIKNGLVEEPQTPEWQDYFEMDIPEPMFEMDQLNKEAIAQYGYIEEIESDSSEETLVLEHYLIVMMESREDMASYETEITWNADSYYHNVTQSLRESKDKFDEVEDEPETVQLNGLPCVRNEAIAGMDVRDDWIELYYELAVVEGENAFYQIITWCPLEQRSIFETDMELIINSFKEK